MIISKEHDLCIWLMMKADKENREKILSVLENAPDYFFTTKQKEWTERKKCLEGVNSKFPRIDRDKELYHFIDPPNSGYLSVDYDIHFTGVSVGLYVTNSSWYQFQWLFNMSISPNFLIKPKKNINYFGDITINCGFSQNKICNKDIDYYGDQISYYFKETPFGLLLISYIQEKNAIGFGVETPKKFRGITLVKYQDIPFNEDITFNKLRELCELEKKNVCVKRKKLKL